MLLERVISNIEKVEFSSTPLMYLQEAAILTRMTLSLIVWLIERLSLRAPDLQGFDISPQVMEENPNNLMMRRAGSLQELTQESWLKELGMQLMRICSQRQDKFVCMCKKALVKLNNVWAKMLSNLSFTLTVQIKVYILILSFEWDIFYFVKPIRTPTKWKCSTM